MQDLGGAGGPEAVGAEQILYSQGNAGQRSGSSGVQLLVGLLGSFDGPGFIHGYVGVYLRVQPLYTF